MSKNLVLCLDGTGNEYGPRNTNVVKLHSALARDPDKQITFYDPGVGTFSEIPSLTQPGRLFRKVLGLAFGFGLRKNVEEAYRFLIHNYSPGDQVYLFGFSRGAYTARVVAALIRAYGILPREHENLIPYALRYLEIRRSNDGSKRKKSDRTQKKVRAFFKRLTGFRRQFGGPKPEYLFLGLWDTVSSVSWAFDYHKYTFTARNTAVTAVRHAVSIDERRAFFRTNLWRPDDDQDVKEVWFAGTHSDVGGWHPVSEIGLSQVALEWMVGESQEHAAEEGRTQGLLFDPRALDHVLHEPTPPDEDGPVHRSLKGFWWICEFWPKWVYHPRLRRRVPHWNLARRRTIRTDAVIHESVLRKLGPEESYEPPNLPSPVRVEPWIRLDGTQMPGDRTSQGDLATQGARILAKRRWNPTSFCLEAGKAYRFRARGRWFDREIEHGPTGGASKNLLLKLCEGMRRRSNAKWFSVIGCLDRDYKTHFDIGRLIETNSTYLPTTTGTLYCYANDVFLAYRNNSGEILLECEEV